MLVVNPATVWINKKTRTGASREQLLLKQAVKSAATPETTFMLEATLSTEQQGE